jgi:drug/metabolite transporter (DMT)-like permease
MQKTIVKIILVYAIACIIWGSTWMAIRISLDSFTPFLSAGFRFLLASVFIYSLMKFKGIKIQTDKLSITLYLLMGFFSFVIPFGLVYWGEQFVPSGLASVLFAVNPFFVAIFSYYFIASEKVGAHKILGIVLGFAGLLVIFSENLIGDIPIYLPGMLAVVISAIMQGGLQVTIKKYGGNLHPLSMNLVPMIIAGVVMTLIGYFFEDMSKVAFTSSGYLSVAYLALFGSLVTFTSYYWLLKRVSVIVLSLIAFITPIIALILGWLFLSEELSTRHLVGSFMVLLGVLSATLGNFRSMKKISLLKKQQLYN